MSNDYNSQPGVYIYDTFTYPENKNMFMTVIYAEIEPLQYWRDRPLLISTPNPITALAVNMTSDQLAEMTESDTVIDGIAEVHALGPVLEEQVIASEIIGLSMIEFACEQSSGSGCGSASGQGAEVFDFIEFIDEFNLVERIGLTQTPEEEYEELVVDYVATYIPVAEQIKAIEDTIEPQYLPENNEEQIEYTEESWKPLGEPKDQWYGIPLLNLGPTDTPLGESYLVQLNSKDNWNVSLLNSVVTGQSKDTLLIDKQIPPNKKFMVGFYVIQNKYGLILRIEGDPKIYQKEVNTFNDRELIPKAISYGVDNDFIKSLSGYMWDVLFWKQPSNFNHNVPSVEPTYPQGGWVYDFRKTGVYSDSVGGTIDGNTVRSIHDYGPSARVGSGPNNQDGKFIQLVPSSENIATGFPGIHPWYFIWDSYMDNFFCRQHLKKDSFTIQWYQWLPRYPIGVNAWISDSIFSNYLSYDYTDFRLTMEFNGRRYQEIITLPEEIWGGFALRYNKITGDLIFSFTDLQYNITEQVQFNIGRDLEFELQSLFGRYDKDEQEYTEAHLGLMGMVMINQDYQSDADLFKTNHEVGLYLNQYKPTVEQAYALQEQNYFKDF